MKKNGETEIFYESKNKFRWMVTILIFLIAVLATALAFLYTGGNFTFFSRFSGGTSPMDLPPLSVTPPVVTTTSAPATTRPRPVYTQAPEDTLTSEIALVADLNEDKIIFTKNADTETSPASLTKIVTASLILREYGDRLGTTYVTVPEEAIRPFRGTIASVVPLKAGETLTMLDLLHCILLPSACDAANVIAYYYGGGDPQPFVDAMNAYVDSIGCTNTHFMNAHGLDAKGQYTTAQDMYIITKEALNIPGFSAIVSKSSYTLSKNGPDLQRKISTTNALICKDSPYYFPYAKGVKTGSTSKAGRCLITTAEKDGFRYLSITMKAPFNAWETDKEKIFASQIDGLHLLQWAFSCAGVETP